MAIITPYNFRPEELKNAVINGDMRIAQRGTSFAAIATNTYHLDRWKTTKTGAMVHTVSQDTDVPTFAQSGYYFQNSMRYNLTTPDTAIAATDRCEIVQVIEGHNWVRLAQKVCTLSFWVKATLPGIYCVSLTNTAGDRSIIKEYTISAANTWQYVSLTFAASPSAGTWNYTNGEGLFIRFCLAAGSNFISTADSWLSANVTATANQVNGVNTGATDFRLTGVMFNIGSEAAPFALFGGDISGEIEACQRYFEKSYNLDVNPGTVTNVGRLAHRNSGTTGRFEVRFATRKRTTPTVTSYTPNAGTSGNIRNETAATNLATNGSDVSEKGFWYSTGGADQDVFGAHFTAEAEM